jgi:hypothetical protein
VDFATPEAKLAAIARSEQPLIGRRLLIKDGEFALRPFLILLAELRRLILCYIGDDFTGRPSATSATGDATDAASSARTPSGTGHSKTAQKILRAQKQPPAPTLFLGNLGFETTEKSIRELFEAHRPQVDNTKGKADPTEDVNDTQDQSKDPWIRKVRLGTFEDSGLCKG